MRCILWKKRVRLEHNQKQISDADGSKGLCGTCFGGDGYMAANNEAVLSSEKNLRFFNLMDM